MKREVKGLFGKCFQFAFDIAKKAERALQQELGDPNLCYIEYGYLAGKEGLLAGQKLYQDKYNGSVLDSSISGRCRANPSGGATSHPSEHLLSAGLPHRKKNRREPD